MIYDADYFIAKFEAIPEELWCINHFESGNACCAFGHCGARVFNPTVESGALSGVLNEVGCGVLINDGDDQNFQQPTPKQRILAALKQVKERETA